MSARVSKKAPKDANAPKKPLSSYFMFTRDRRAALKAENPDMKVTELTKVMSAEWKALDAAAKQRYADEAAAAKSAYAVKWAEYQKTSEFGKHMLKVREWKAQSVAAGGDFKATKKPKDEKAPKRPQTAYFLFTAAERAAVKAAQPELKVTQIAKELGKRWKALSDADKAPFVAKAAAAKKAYDAQLATYKQSADFAAHEQAIDDWKRGEKAGKAQAAGNAPKVTLPRKPKDANCPKRPQSAYFFFTASRRAELSAAHPDKKITEIAKLMGAEWKALSEDDRAPFAAQAAKAKAAYAPKMEAYAGSAEQKAFKLKLQEWSDECDRRRQKALAKMDKQMADLEVSKKKAKKEKAKGKGKAAATKKGKGKGRGKKFAAESSSDESDSDDESDSSSGSEDSSSGSESGSDESSSEEESSYSD